MAGGGGDSITAGTFRKFDGRASKVIQGTSAWILGLLGGGWVLLSTDKDDPDFRADRVG